MPTKETKNAPWEREKPYYSWVRVLDAFVLLLQSIAQYFILLYVLREAWEVFLTPMVKIPAPSILHTSALLLMLTLARLGLIGTRRFDIIAESELSQPTDWREKHAKLWRIGGFNWAALISSQLIFIACRHWG